MSNLMVFAEKLPIRVEEKKVSESNSDLAAKFQTKCDLQAGDFVVFKEGCWAKESYPKWIGRIYSVSKDVSIKGVEIKCLVHSMWFNDNYPDQEYQYDSANWQDAVDLEKIDMTIERFCKELCPFRPELGEKAESCKGHTCGVYKWECDYHKTGNKEDLRTCCFHTYLEDYPFHISYTYDDKWFEIFCPNCEDTFKIKNWLLDADEYTKWLKEKQKERMGMGVEMKFDIEEERSSSWWSSFHYDWQEKFESGELSAEEVEMFKKAMSRKTTCPSCQFERNIEIWKISFLHLERHESKDIMGLKEGGIA